MAIVTEVVVKAGYEEIYDKLVAVRTRMGQKLGGFEGKEY